MTDTLIAPLFVRRETYVHMMDAAKRASADPAQLRDLLDAIDVLEKERAQNEWTVDDDATMEAIGRGYLIGDENGYYNLVWPEERDSEKRPLRTLWESDDQQIVVVIDQPPIPSETVKKLVKFGALCPQPIHVVPQDPLRARISGRFQVPGPPMTNELHLDVYTLVNPNLSGKEFLVDIVMSWEILCLKNLQYGRFHLFGHAPEGLSLSDNAERKRDPRILGDILYDTVVNVLCAKGHIALDADRSDGFVETELWPESITVSEILDVRVDANGFAGGRMDTLGLMPSLSITAFGRRYIEDTVLASARKGGQLETISLSLIGNGIGKILFHTGWRDDSSTYIQQDIRTLSFVARFDREGMRLSLDGELDDFNPRELERHLKQHPRNPPLKPFTAYSAKATLPWAYLVAREFKFLPWAKDRGFL